MEHQMSRCSIGLYLQTEADCHKTTYTRNSALKQDLKTVEQLKPDSFDLLKRRIGPEYQIQSTDTVCLHHEKCLLDKYIHLQTACCDPYKKHKSSVKKALRVVDISLSDTFLAIGLNVKPGFKLCRNCFECTTRSHHDNGSDISYDDDGDPDFVLPVDQLQTSLSNGFATIGCSPLKLSKYPKRQRSSYVERKVRSLGEALATATSPDCQSILTSEKVCTNCEDLEALVSELKEKCALVSKQQKI